MEDNEVAGNGICFWFLVENASKMMTKRFGIILEFSFILEHCSIVIYILDNFGELNRHDEIVINSWALVLNQAQRPIRNV